MAVLDLRFGIAHRIDYPLLRGAIHNGHRTAPLASGVRPPLALAKAAGERTAGGGSADNLLSIDDNDVVTNEDRQRRERHVFTFRRWHVHRNSNELNERAIAMKTLVSQSSSRLNSFLQNLMFTRGRPVCVPRANGCYQTLREQGFLPENFPLLQLSDGPLELTSFALSLLLVFRTDSSYSRWTEALDVWSNVRNTSKDIVRDAVCWVKDPSLLSAIVRWTLTYAHSLKVYLRENGDIDTATVKLLLKHEHKQFVNLCRDTSSAYPQYALHVLTQAVARAGLFPNREDRLLTGLANLNTCIGSCEKLLRYPIPLSYTRHTSRFMIIWLAFLPLALWDDAGWASVPITTIISFLLLGIEEIGVAIEEPFALIPLKDIVKDIERDLWAIAASRKEVSELLDLSLSLSAGDTLKEMIATSLGDCGPTPPSPPANGFDATNSQLDWAATTSPVTAPPAHASHVAPHTPSPSPPPAEGHNGNGPPHCQEPASQGSANAAEGRVGGGSSADNHDSRRDQFRDVAAVLANVARLEQATESVLFDSMEELPSEQPLVASNRSGSA